MTTKTVDDQLLFAPSAELHYRVAKIIERAQAKFPDYTLLDFTLMGNHPHHVFRTTSTRPARVLQYLHAPIARWVNRLHGRRGAVFGQRYRDKALLDSAATINAWIYSAANPVRAHLVGQLKDWEGFSTWPAVAAGKKEHCVAWFDESSWRRRGAKESQRERFVRRAVVKVGVPVEWEGLDPERLEREHHALRARMREVEAENVCEHVEVELATQHRDVSASPPRTAAPKEPRRGWDRAAGARHLVERHRVAYVLVVPLYRRQSAEYRRSGGLVPFPDGTYPPWIPEPREWL
ncbi:MAG: hypothetical protein K1X94_21475 [Sandaracinaceae bacterium]|nr:hypothetical protein [Sandaracinaceae bacterium]